MKAFLKKTVAAILAFSLLAISLLFTGCTPSPYKGYEGEFPELCAVAWATIPTTKGYKVNSEGGEPYVSSLETDGYGRILFFYSEDYENEKGYVAIMQRTDGANAYYYPDGGYVPITRASDKDAIDLNTSEIVALKERSDWGLSLNEEKCKATKIDKFPIPGELGLSGSFFDDLLKEYYEYQGRYVHPKNGSLWGFFRSVMTDDYGRSLYYIESYFHEYTHKSHTSYFYCFLVVINPDKSYDVSKVVLLENENDPREDEKWIKEQTGWNVAP